MDWEKASAELAKKLDPAHVKGRKQGGGTVQFIEGWHAISEMNRIFGFGAWDRETVDLRQLGAAREVDNKQRVDFMARVRVTVHAADGTSRVREGCGFGQGIDRDMGQAYESAIKEAETDAMKRAMMTFGNPFGLALYDKSRENVGVDESPFDAAAAEARITGSIGRVGNDGDLVKLWKHEAATIKQIGGEGEARITAAFKARKAELTPEMKGAA